MKRRPRPGTRHRRLQQTLRSPARARRQLRTRAARLEKRALIEMFRSDDRLVPPSWAWDMVYGGNTNRPSDLAILTGA